MSKKTPATGLEHSIYQRLLNLSRGRKEEFQFVLTRYAMERLLYRLGESKHRGKFVLKGAMLFQLWTKQPHRPTHDLDLLERGATDAASVQAIFQEVCRQPVAPDGMTFDDANIQVTAVREDQEYQGLRVRFASRLSNARIPIQIDIGTGDAVTPEPVETEYPSLLDLPKPRLRTYPRETVVAEKFQAMVMLGMANSRIKDFYDLWVLARDFSFDGRMLSEAIAATFTRRRTALPDETPVALTDEFWQAGNKWGAFLSKNKLPAEGAALEGVLDLLRRFLLPPASALRFGSPFRAAWDRGDWRT
jgi:hypothetical protein